MLELEPINNTGRRCMNCGHVRSEFENQSQHECPACHAIYDRVTHKSLTDDAIRTRSSRPVTGQHTAYARRQRNTAASLSLPLATRNLLLTLAVSFAGIITAIVLRLF